MPFLSGQKARVLVGDFSFSPVTAQVSADWPTDMLDHTTIADSAKVFIPGQDTSTSSLSGWLDVSGAADAHLDQLNDLKAATAPEPYTFAPNGFALGETVWMAGALAAGFSTGSQVADRVTYSLNLQTSGTTELGISLHDLVAVTADGDGASYDGTVASSASGAVAHLHVTAFSGFSAASIVVADSANDSTFATIGTFASVAGITQERLVIAGTVRRYLRYSIDVTGSGSITFAVTFARR
jgi:hypothetical protein